mgnify:CR=1 FL=1
MTTTSPGEPVLSITGLSKRFGAVQALKDIDLAIPRGQVVVVLGPSGSGKSTLCRTINRLEPIDEGEIRIEGELLPAEGKDLARLRRHIGERGKIEPRRKNGTSAKHQRSLTVAIKRARYLALLPYVVK